MPHFRRILRTASSFSWVSYIIDKGCGCRMCHMHSHSIRCNRTSCNFHLKNEKRLYAFSRANPILGSTYCIWEKISRQKAVIIVGISLLFVMFLFKAIPFFLNWMNQSLTLHLWPFVSLIVFKQHMCGLAISNLTAIPFFLLNYTWVSKGYGCFPDFWWK